MWRGGACVLGDMERDERGELLRNIERYGSLLKGVSDERLRRELERLLNEARQRLREFDQRA
jgi:hypothetical protein